MAIPDSFESVRGSWGVVGLGRGDGDAPVRKPLDRPAGEPEVGDGGLVGTELRVGEAGVVAYYRVEVVVSEAVTLSRFVPAGASLAVQWFLAEERVQAASGEVHRIVCLPGGTQRCHGSRPTPAGSTLPVEPSTVMSCPSLRRTVASPQPTTAGIPYSRAMIEAWASGAADVGDDCCRVIEEVSPRRGREWGHENLAVLELVELG